MTARIHTGVRRFLVGLQTPIILTASASRCCSCSLMLSIFPCSVYLPTCLPPYLPTCVPAYLSTCLPAYLPELISGSGDQLTTPDLASQGHNYTITLAEFPSNSFAYSKRIYESLSKRNEQFCPLSYANSKWTLP